MSFAAMVGVGTVAGAVTGTATDPLVAVVVAVISSSGVAGLISWLSRRSTGEGPAAAVRDLAESAARLAEVSDDMTLPLLRRIADQQSEIALLTERLSNARIEVHTISNDAATLASELAKRDYELETYRVRAGEQPDRRKND